MSLPSLFASRSETRVVDAAGRLAAGERPEAVIDSLDLDERAYERAQVLVDRIRKIREATLELVRVDELRAAADEAQRVLANAETQAGVGELRQAVERARAKLDKALALTAEQRYLARAAERAAADAQPQRDRARSEALRLGRQVPSLREAVAAHDLAQAGLVAAHAARDVAIRAAAEPARIAVLEAEVARLEGAIRNWSSPPDMPDGIASRIAALKAEAKELHKLDRKALAAALERAEAAVPVAEARAQAAEAALLAAAGRL